MRTIQKFGLIREIDLSKPETYEDRFFLTLDIDWAPDFVIRDVDLFLRELEVPATWFVTHSSSAVDALRGCENYELGIHPNFSPLLKGGNQLGDAKQILDVMRTLVPEAVSIRCHNLVQSSVLLDLFRESGLKFDCNVFLPFAPISALSPWLHTDSFIRVPYCWEDDTYLAGFCRSPAEVMRSKGMKVIDSHPIHLWLNTDVLSRYESVKHRMNDEQFLRLYRYENDQNGVRNIVRWMIDLVKSERK